MVLELRLIPSPNNKYTMAWLKSIGRDKLPRYTNEITKKLAYMIRDNAKRAAETQAIYGGKKPGELAKSIEAKKITASKNRITWSIIAYAPYAMYVETGTKPHPQANNPIFRPPREHPGAKGYPLQHFFTRAFQNSVPAANYLMDGEFDNIFGKTR